MPRVLRNYERRDFSALLDDLHKESSDIQKDVIPSCPQPIITKEKRARDSLLSNPRMLYAYSSCVPILHDRDCPHVRMIEDRHFRMLSSFSKEMPVCSHCYRKALVRAAIIDDFKRIDAYLHILHLLNVSNIDLYALIINHHAQVLDVGFDFICLKVAQDRWKIQIVRGVPRLYHNNYYCTDTYDRFLTDGFHLQNDGGIHTFHHFLHLMTSYSWEFHVEKYKNADLAKKRCQLQLELASLRTYTQQKRPLSLYAYYHFLDCGNISQEIFQSAKLSMQIITDTSLPQHPYHYLTCRVPRWQRKRFLAALDTLNLHIVAANNFDYADQCRALFSQA